MADEPWTIGRVLGWASADLRRRGAESPRLDAELLLGEVLGCDRVKLITDGQRPLTKAELSAYRELHKRRRSGEPVAYLRGRREFYGRMFHVDRRVLVPRPETELLVEVALRRSRHLSLSARCLDLCTGSGCVAITLARERPTTTVLASDISTDALAVARANALRLGALIGLWHSDLYDALQGQGRSFDLITANPPYLSDRDMVELPVEVRQFEPSLALEAGGDGLSVIRRLVSGAPAMLRPRGVLALEVGAGTAEQVCQLLSDAGFCELSRDRDYGGHERVVSGIWTPRS